MLGFATFGILSFHIVESSLLPVAAVPVLYAAAMLSDAGAALLTGWAFDRFGPRVLIALPITAALIPIFAFSNNVAAVIVGSLLWGAALGIQESTLRATVAGFIGPGRRSTAYGIFAAVVGIATTGGGVLAGALYEISISTLILLVGAIQAVAVTVLIVATMRRPKS